MSPTLVVALALAFSPFKAEQEQVRAGNEALVAGDPQAALRHYDDAERAVGAHPEIDYDRGHAAYRAGRLDEAVEHFRRAADRAPAPLASRALQNAGNALAAKGDHDRAVGAFREALRRDPSNEDARYDLEVLLRRKEQPPPPKSEKNPEEQGPAPKQEQGEGQQQGKPPPRPGEQGEQMQQAPRPDEGDARQEPGGERKEPKGGEARDAEREGLSKQDAERLLDALRAREKRMPQDPRRGRRSGRTDVERDW